MKTEVYDKERRRGAHLHILIVLTIAAIGICLSAVSLQWQEVWMLPFVLFGVVLCWLFHVRQILTETQRIRFFAFIALSIILLDGVHATSLFDISMNAALFFVVFSGADDKGILHAGFIIYLFELFWQILLIAQGRSVAVESLVISQLVQHSAIVLVIYRTAVGLLARRSADREINDRELQSLKDMQKRTEDFLANVSHELRTPINVVMGIGSVMMRNATNARDKENATSVFRAGKRLSDQVEDLLDYTEIDNGKLLVAEEPYVIASVVNDVLNDLNLYGREGLPEVIVDVDADTPARLYGDGRFIKKILRQLIENALKFTEKGGVYVRIYPDAREYGLNLCIDVQDTGIGMSRQELEKVRSTAFQADSDTTRRAGGLGLGFPIVNGIVRAMEGFSYITSAPGEGTRVHVSVPQRIHEGTRCMSIRDPEQIRGAFFQDPAKFAVPAVREFYSQMILHVIQSFQLTMKRVTTLKDLKRMVGEEPFTHLFVADEEYGYDPAFFDRLGKTMHVIVVAKNTFHASPASPITVLQKPLCSFPLVEVLNMKDPGEAKDILQQGTEASFAGVRALVVDDEMMNLMVAEDIFSEYGMEVTTAPGGQEALDVLATEEYDVIFMDHMMPEMDGVECMHRIRAMQNEQNRRSAIIALTANAVSGARDMFLREGFDGFLAKPIERTELVRVLLAALGRQGA